MVTPPAEHEVPAEREPRDVVRTTSVYAQQWLVCVAMASAVLWVSELHKLLGRLWRVREAGRLTARSRPGTRHAAARTG